MLLRNNRILINRNNLTLYLLVQPFFDTNDGVRLLCSASTVLSVQATSYGKDRYSTGSYGAPFYAAAGLLTVRFIFSFFILRLGQMFTYILSS